MQKAKMAMNQKMTDKWSKLTQDHKRNNLNLKAMDDDL